MSGQAVTLILLVPLYVVLGLLAYRIVARLFRPGAPGTEVPVRCRDGHVFVTDWIPGISFRAVRLGNVRFQYCPVGRHWTYVTRLEA